MLQLEVQLKFFWARSVTLLFNNFLPRLSLPSKSVDWTHFGGKVTLAPNPALWWVLLACCLFFLEGGVPSRKQLPFAPVPARLSAWLNSISSVTKPAFLFLRSGKYQGLGRGSVKSADILPGFPGKDPSAGGGTGRGLGGEHGVKEQGWFRLVGKSEKSSQEPSHIKPLSFLQRGDR